MAKAAEAGIGHNLPPEEDQLMIEQLEKDHDDILSTYQLNLAKAEDAPLDVSDDESAGKIGDIKKKLKTSITMLEAARKAEKAPYMAKAGIVQAFFASRIEKLDALWKKLDAPHAAYLKAKEDEKRRAREEKARQDAEEAAQKLRAAEEAARVAREEKKAAEEEAQRIAAAAEQARKDREAEAERIRKEAAAEAERVKKAAEEEAERKRKAAEEEQRIARERIAQLEKEKKEAEEKRQKEILQAEDDKKAQDARLKEIEAEKKRLEKEAEENRKNSEKEAAQLKRDALREAETKVTDANREARALEREGRAEERQADAAISDLNKEVRQFEREGDRAMDDAVRADRVAARSEKATMEKGSILSRTRGETSLSSVTERWVGSVADRDELIYSAREIWDHIPFAALEQAVQSWVNANKENRSLRGAIIIQETKTVNR